MQMVDVVAKEAFAYDGVNRRIGETFEATVDDARIMELIGRVVLSMSIRDDGSVTLTVEPPEPQEPQRRRRRQPLEESGA